VTGRGRPGCWRRAGLARCLENQCTAGLQSPDPKLPDASISR
jgi:hypothetical protein